MLDLTTKIMEIRQELFKAVIKMGFQEIDNSLDKNEKYYLVNDDSVTLDHYNYQMDRFAMYALLILKTHNQMVEVNLSKDLFISSVAQKGLTELKDLIWKHLNND